MTGKQSQKLEGKALNRFFQDSLLKLKYRLSHKYGGES
jgi:hypothetical protein